MRRGDIFLAAMDGDYANPRPVVVVQADVVGGLESTIICPLTTFEEPAAWLRPVIDPTPTNALERRSFAMVDKVGAARPHRFRGQVGRASPSAMLAIDRALLILLGLA